MSVFFVIDAGKRNLMEMKIHRGAFGATLELWTDELRRIIYSLLISEEFYNEEVLYNIRLALKSSEPITLFGHTYKLIREAIISYVKENRRAPDLDWYDAYVSIIEQNKNQFIFKERFYLPIKFLKWLLTAEGKALTPANRCIWNVDELSSYLAWEAKLTPFEALNLQVDLFDRVDQVFTGFLLRIFLIEGVVGEFLYRLEDIWKSVIAEVPEEDTQELEEIPQDT